MSKDAGSSECSGSGCSSGGSSSGSSSSLSRGEVAGIAVGAVVGFFLLLGILLFYIRRHRQKSRNKAIDPRPNVSVLTGPVHNGGPPESSLHDEHDSLPQSAFWSPDTLNDSSGLTASRNNGSSGGSGCHENSSGENELDGHNTQIKPVYHELPGSKVPNVY
jgi:preprotein translocase subunit SecG